MKAADFTKRIQKNGYELYREMPWRLDTRPYFVLVSEIMLQQTQVSRVIPKFEAFIRMFPTIAALSQANLTDVLKLWQGLGYNRRAKYLLDTARKIMHEYNGDFPASYKALLTLPGVGKNTAGAIMAYAYNEPAIFIETNIRTVYIHHYFADAANVTDQEIIEKLRETMNTANPREFYWALMDYGTWLKANGIRNTTKSKHYMKQSPLTGSLREMRGWIVKDLTLGHGSMAVRTLLEKYGSDTRYEPAMESLATDLLILQTATEIHLTK